MRKQIVDHNFRSVTSVSHGWLDLQRLAQVEFTSEDATHPIESALSPEGGQGWRATEGGEQLIRFVFDEVQHIRRIQLLFDEHQRARTQEFVLRWLPDREQSYREIVRQQYNFSPPGMVRELEDYTVDLVGVTALELSIVPDISGSDAFASVSRFLVA